MKKKEEKKDKSYIETVTDKIGEIAVHYGFTVIKPPKILNEDISKAKQFKDHDHYEDALEKIALTRWYTENRMDLESQPVAIHYKKPFPNSNKKKGSKEIYGLEVMGSGRSTSEALILKCTLSILEELGYENLFIDINSIGDRESISRFERDMNSHYRKNSHLLPAKIKPDWKKNFHTVLKNSSDEIKEFLENAPQPVGSLSELSRTHFKEVLENLETFEASYKIKPNLFSNKNYASYTIFEIREISEKKEEDGELLAYGYRYNNLAKKIGGKREIPSVGMTIMVKKNKEKMKKIPVKKIKRPKLYLVQLGTIAKMKALNVVEMLRKNKIPVHHSITKDKITGQLSGAEYMKSSHVLIIGQKEAIENSVVVRNVVTREQETVNVKELPDFLKKLDK